MIAVMFGKGGYMGLMDVYSVFGPWTFLLGLCSY